MFNLFLLMRGIGSLIPETEDKFKVEIDNPIFEFIFSCSWPLSKFKLKKKIRRTKSLWLTHMKARGSPCRFPFYSKLIAGELNLYRDARKFRDPAGLQ